MWKLILLLNLTGSLFAAATASGTMTVNGRVRELKAVRAVKLVDEGQEVVRVFISDAPVAASKLSDQFAMMSISREDGVNGVQFDFRNGGVAVSLRTKDYAGSFSRSQSPNPYEVKIAGALVAGEVRDEYAADSGSGLTYQIALTFSAPIEAHAEEAAPTAADLEAAVHNPAAVGYLDFMDALRLGDRARIRKYTPKEALAEIDSPEFSDLLKELQQLVPQQIQVLRAHTEGGSTRLWLSSKNRLGKPRSGEVTMKLQDSRWIMGCENWHE